MRRRIMTWPIFVAVCIFAANPAWAAPLISNAPMNFTDFAQSPLDTDPHNSDKTKNTETKIKQDLRNYADKYYFSEIDAVAQIGVDWINAKADRYRQPAIVLDIDETSLTNLPQMKTNNFDYLKDEACPQDDKKKPTKDYCGSIAWDKSEAAKAISGTRKIYDAARKHHVAVFFITGRDESERSWTTENLKREGYGEIAGLYMSTTPKPAWIGIYKSDKRKEIQDHGYHILLTVGDQISDVYGGNADKGLLYPNPFYRLP